MKVRASVKKVMIVKSKEKEDYMSSIKRIQNLNKDKVNNYG